METGSVTMPHTNRLKLPSASSKTTPFGTTLGVRVTGKDCYGRTLADVTLPDGRNLNHELVKAGYAWCYRRYAPHDRELERLEKEARDAKRGLWSDPHAIPPWEYRKRSRVESY